MGQAEAWTVASKPRPGCHVPRGLPPPSAEVGKGVGAFVAVRTARVARGRGTHDVPRGRSVPCGRRSGFAVTLLRETWSSHIRIRNGSRRHMRVAEPGRWPGRRVDSGPVRSSCWPRLGARAAPSRPEPWPSAKRGCWPVTRRVTVGAQERTGRQVAPLESGPFHVAGSGRSLQGGVPAGGQSGGGRPGAASPSPVCTRTPPAPSWAS